MSVFVCLQVIVVAMTVISVGAYEIEGDVVFSNANVAPHRAKSRSRNLSLDQPFIDKTVGLQTSASIRGRAADQRTFRDVSWKDRAVYPSGFPIFPYQPIKQNSFTLTTFRDKPFLRSTILKNGELRGERSVLRDNPFEGQSLTSEEIFEGQASTYGSQAPFKEQLFTAEMPFKNLFSGQSSSAEQASFQKQATFVESPPVSNSIKFYRDDYVKPIDSYERYKDILTTLDGKSLPYTKYGEFIGITQFREHTIETLFVQHHVRENKFFPDNGHGSISFFSPSPLQTF